MGKKIMIGATFLFSALITLISLMAGCSVLTETTTTTTTVQRQWTIMMFSSGDNDLEEHIFNNINEMEKTGSTGEVAMVVEADWWKYSGSSESIGPGEATGEGVARWYILKDADMNKIKSQLVESLPEINTGTEEALQDFAVWAIQKYPAEHYMLIVSSHGGGWRSRGMTGKGVGQDYTSDPTKQLLISLPQIKKILPSIYAAAGNKKLDIFAFDSCLNGALELAYQLKDYFDIMIGSEDNVPGSGYPYDVITADLLANSSMSAEALAKIIVNKYYSYYGEAPNKQKSTLAAIDLSKVATLANEVKNLIALYDNTTKEALLREIIDAHTDAYNYQVQRYHDVTFRDLWDMADKIISSSESYSAITAEAMAIKGAVEQAVILSKYTIGASDQYSVAGSHGLSIYFSTKGTSAYDTDYDGLDFSSDTGWGNFLKNNFQ